MVSYRLLLSCLVVGTAYLAAISFALDALERKLRLTADIPASLLEQDGLTSTIVSLLMETLFYVVIPALGYSFFYLVIPFSGIRAGFAGALLALVIGSAPVVMRLSVRLKLPLSYLLYLVLSHFLKLAGTLALIGYLYAL